ncbi:MAG: tetratricopeptide (TPR) repeat protein [Planctomycetota bacterium]|jgi:tetratricopeptide (TPR) repeat protein
MGIRISRTLGLLACLNLAAPLLAVAPRTAQEPGQSRGSLQGLLGRLRGDYAKRSVGLAAEVQTILEQVESLAGRNLDRALVKHRKSLLALCPNAAPLLIPALDPGKDRELNKVRRAKLVVDVLKQGNCPAITDALIAAADMGSIDGRLNALQVLSTSQEPARVAPAIRDLYQRSTGPLQRDALVTLSLLGGKEAEEMINAALNDEVLALATVALDALSSTKNLAAGERILKLAASERGVALVTPLLRYFSAVPAALDEEEAVEVMITLALDKALLTGQRISILDHLREREELDLSRTAHKAIEPVTTSVRQDVAEAALAMLARHGDKRARKKLLNTYDDKVSRQPSYTAVYAKRAAVLERIGAWSDAVSDFKQAIKHARRGENDPDVYRGIARCLAQMKKYKDAAKYLSDSPLSFKDLRELAQDKAFAGMLNSKYRTHFHLTEDR